MEEQKRHVFWLRAREAMYQVFLLAEQWCTGATHHLKVFQVHLRVLGRDNCCVAKGIIQIETNVALSMKWEQSKVYLSHVDVDGVKGIITLCINKENSDL